MTPLPTVSSRLLSARLMALERNRGSGTVSSPHRAPRCADLSPRVVLRPADRPSPGGLGMHSAGPTQPEGGAFCRLSHRAVALSLASPVSLTTALPQKAAG